jgi:FkbM family methyltransferase
MEEGEEDDEESSTLTVAALKGSESEVAFIHHEIFPPHASKHGNWGYLKHGITIAKEERKRRDAPAPAVVILDVGANIGLFGLYLDMYAQEEDEEEESELLVVAIEPAPRTFAALKYNLASHGVKHIAVQKAVVGEEQAGGKGGEDLERKGLLRFYPHMPGNSTLVGKDDPDKEKLLPQGINPRLRTHLQEGMEEMEVELTTVSALLREHGLNKIDLLKIDVEGQEEAVLQGIREEDWPFIAQVVMEVHTGVERRKERIDLLLKTKGEFTSVVWEVPEWAKDNDQMDNAMVYATRSKGKDKDQTSEMETEWEKEEG